MSIELRQLSFSYSRAVVLHEVTASLRPAAITAVLGPNASGKSTLLRCIIGSLTPTAGVALIDGEPAHRARPRTLAQCIAYVSQRPIVSAAFTVRQVLELGRFALAPSRARIDDAIERLDLAAIAHRRYTELSVGQQQRVALARAVAQLEPNGHLVLDEPTSAMDLRHVSECMALLKELATRGVSVLVAMHDLSLAASVSDECWLLTQGRCVAAGPVGDVLTPDRLRAIFEVDFTVITDPDGVRRLLPRASQHRSAASGTTMEQS